MGTFPDSSKLDEFLISFTLNKILTLFGIGIVIISIANAERITHIECDTKLSSNLRSCNMQPIMVYAGKTSSQACNNMLKTAGVFIVAAKRTPFGAFGGKLANKTPTELQVIAAKAALAAGNIDPKTLDSSVIGNIISCSAVDATYISRHVLLHCGGPVDKPALTINRLCGSGFQAIINAAQEIAMGDSKVVLTGGVDNMSMAPYLLRKIRFGTKLGQELKMDDALWTSLTDSYCQTPMGLTAENLAEQSKISRDESEDFALRSQQNWKKANDAGYFKEEIVPIPMKVKGKETVIDTDEHPKPATTKEGLAKLPSVFKKDGTVTPGTASGVSDGAAAVIVASEAAVKEYNLKPLARLVGYGVTGCEPKIMGIGPVSAIKKALHVSGKSLGDMDLIEINEAFAPQALACVKELGIDMNKFNVNGGAIALGHPLAASGARITGHLVHEMRRRNANYAIGSACIGGGQGIALVLEKC